MKSMKLPIGTPVMLYREGSDPKQEDAEWRRVLIRPDRQRPRTYSVEESSGFGKKQPLPEPTVVCSGVDLSQAESQGNAAIDRFEEEGFWVYDERTWRTPQHGLR